MQRSHRNNVSLAPTSRIARTMAAVLAPICAASALLLVAPVSAQAGNPCTSEWIKFKHFFDQNGPKVAKGICQYFNKDDVAAAKKCITDFEAAKAKVDATINTYNGKVGDSQWKVGPRGLGENQWLDGTLLAERTFAGPPVMSDKYRLEFQRTGGKARNTLQATVCFLDERGNSALSPVLFSVDRNHTQYDHTFSGVAGLTPVILLKKSWGFDGHKYKIRGNSGAEPEIVSKAREAGTGGKNSGVAPCANPCPDGGSYDGANCYVGTPPGGTKAFLYAGNYYYTPKANKTCPVSGSNYDGANCYVRRAPAQAFIWSNNWYYKACR